MPLDFAVTIETLPEKGIMWVRLSGNLDAHTFEQVQEVVSDAFAKGKKKILLDMSDVPYMSSAGAGVLIGSLSEADNAGGKLVIYGLRESVLQVFNTLGITEMFTLTTSREAAIAAF